MWKGLSLFYPTADDVVRAAGDLKTSLRLRAGEEVLWVGRASGRYSFLAYYPTTVWTVLGVFVSCVLFLAFLGGAAAGANAVYVYLILASYVTIIVLSVLAIAYSYWRHTGRHDLYAITSKRVIFCMSKGRWAFPWGGVLFDVPMRRDAIRRNGSEAFDLEIERLDSVEIRKLPRADVGNIYFPGWADDRGLGSAKPSLFVFEERAARAAPRGVLVRSLLRIGPRRQFRPSAMFAVEHVTRVGNLLASNINAASRGERAITKPA